MGCIAANDSEDRGCFVESVRWVSDILGLDIWEDCKKILKSLVGNHE
jgi:hypothetical protein